MAKTLAELIVLALVAVGAAAGLFIAFDDNGVNGPTRPRPPAKRGPAAKPRVDETDPQERFLAHDGRERRYLVHVPKGADRSRPLPVVLVFHGGMGRAESVRQQSRMDEVADRHGFLVVYPDGTGVSRLLTFNAGSCCGEAVRERVDDVGFVRELVGRELPRHYKVDRRRVYATGLSNGAMLCYRLACELPELIAAIGPVSGDLGVDGPTPKRPVPVIHFHGMKDPNCPFEGGKGKNAVQPEPHRSVPDTVAWWVKANRCRKEPAEVKRGKDYVETRYEPARAGEGAPVVLYALPEGGHNWPGGVDTTAWLGTGKHIKSVDASEIMWQFFARHPLPPRE